MKPNQKPARIVRYGQPNPICYLVNDAGKATPIYLTPKVDPDTKTEEKAQPIEVICAWVGMYLCAFVLLYMALSYAEMVVFHHGGTR